MWKKIVVVIALLAIVGFSFSLLQKSKPATVSNEQTAQPQEVKETLPETVYNLAAENVKEECSESNEQLCAVEWTVKCTLNPDLAICKKLELPSFIFMKDPSVERPTEMNFRFTDKKVLLNNTTEIYTESTCNGSWFGLCQGTVIYVLAPSSGEYKWQVKDIYAIE
ncbi:MAG: hypothetical protein IJ525_05110 [Alphaproteobacteria bacterium]|nr:hypothetical protein [Alphaproteobacteria bacterium]